jgi:hypothetical protein
LRRVYLNGKLPVIGAASRLCNIINCHANGALCKHFYAYKKHKGK